LKIFFKLLYHQFAWSYDWIADIVSIGRWKTWVYSVIPFLGENMILELGCGPGHLQVAHSSGDASMFGIDSSRQMLNQASRNLSISNLEKKLVLGVAQELPFRDNSFPIVVSTFPSNYIFDPITLNQIWRILNDDGQLIILPAAWITGSNILDRFSSWLFTVTGEAPSAKSDDLESKFAQPFEKLSQAGFQVQYELIDLDSSQVLVIHALKKNLVADDSTYLRVK
jgi:ubiquinone/menaquinone biosynthesis C-methylase UbiE